MTTTIEPGLIVELNAEELGLPLLLVVEIAPVGGIVSLTLDGDLVASWNDTQVSVGQTFDLLMGVAPRTATIGTVRASFAYLVQLGYQIDFDEVFHNAAAHWGLQVPDLQSYLIDGTRKGNKSYAIDVPEVLIDVSDTLTETADSLFLLADTYVFGEQRVDTLPLTLSVEPYPCVRLEVEGNLYTYLEYDVSMADFCARYAPPSDTLCWASTDPLSCISSASGQHTFHIDVPCEAVKDFVVPLCPVKASGSANVSIRSEVVVTQLELHYTCDPPGPVIKGAVQPIVNSSPVTTDSTWLSQTDIAFETDRDDAIFSVEVPLDSTTITLSDGGGQLNPNDSVIEGQTYTIAWQNLDNALKQCCAGSEQVKIVYRAADEADPSIACSQEIVTETDNSSYSWNVSVPCASDAQDFFIIIEFTCPNTGAVLYRAYSDTFAYSIP